MDSFTFKTEWMNLLMMLGLGDAEDLFDAIGVVKDYVMHGEEPTNETLDRISFQASYAANTIINGIKQEAASEAKKRDGKVRGGVSRAKQKLAEVSRSQQNVAEEKEREREEEREEESRENKEASPQTPLEESKESKGEEREEDKEKEREYIRACAHEETALSVDVLPAPAFVPESDPKRLTDKTLEEEFDALWMLYPNKKGRSDALRHYKAARKQGVTYDEVEQGILRYAEYVKGEDPKFIAMGSTWFCGHRWEDQYARGKPKVGSIEWIANL